MKKVFFNSVLVVIVLAHANCGGDNRESLKESLRKDLNSFEAIRKRVEKKYILSDKHKDQARIVLIDCTEKQKVTGKEICDDEIGPQLTQLGISEVRLEKEFCDSGKYRFDKIYFNIANSQLSAISYYVYDYCNEYVKFESDNFYQSSIVDHWSLAIDKSFP